MDKDRDIAVTKVREVLKFLLQEAAPENLKVFLTFAGAENNS